MPDSRPLHLIIIDGWHPGLLRREWARLPAFRFLAAHGSLESEAISTFPTVTPAALTTLATGVPPAEHGIAGILWYHRAEDRYIHYWPSPQSLMTGTLPQVLKDIFLNLNGSHLRPVPTLFEQLEAAGAVCGSVNFPLSRGYTLHRAQLPWLLATAAGIGAELAYAGPRHCYSGDFLCPQGFRRQGFFGRYGINDRRAIAYAVAMIRRERPDFSLIYLNEHDLRSHHAGPMGCGYSLRLLDRELDRLMRAYGSRERAVSEARWIVVGDHAQSRIGGFPGYAVDVSRAFRGLKVASMERGGLERETCDLAIAPNDRSALIYLRDRARLGGVVEQLVDWPSVDQVAWREGGRSWAIASHRTLSWAPLGPWRDPLGQTWSLSGDWGVLDLAPSGPDRLVWGRYPDPLARLDDALAGADLIITARPGYEFTTGMTMGKGNHGSLAQEDTLVPLLMVGVPALPPPVRTRDLAPAILRAFGLAAPPPLTLGSHAWPSSVTG